MERSKWKFAVGGCAVLAMALGAVGCGGSDDDEFGWVGQAAHYEMEGTLDGETLDFVLDETSVGDILKFKCKREYEVPVVDGTPDYSQATFVEVKINAVIELNGNARLAELELKSHDFGADAQGDQISIVPRVDGVAPAANEMWFEWEWHTLDDQDLYESAARQGTFTLEHFTGTPDGNGIIPDSTGEIGGVVHAFWSANEEVFVSFTAPCGENKISEVQ